MNRPLLPLLLVVLLTGCAKRVATPSTSDTVTPPSKPPLAERGQDSRPTEDTDMALATLEAPPIYFPLDSSSLPSGASDELERLARALRQRGLAKVTVSGHTCELGTSEYNLALGQRRAASVRAYLVRLGVESGRISVVSYGEERPVDSTVLEKNRRVEFSFRLAEQAHAGEL